MLIVYLMDFFIAMAWGQAENRCNELGGHAFSFGEEKDVRVIKDLHDTSHPHAQLEYCAGLRLAIPGPLRMTQIHTMQ